MADYKEMYLKLFRSQTEVINILQQAQREAEIMYIEAEAPKLAMLPAEKTKRDNNGQEKE